MLNNLVLLLSFGLCSPVLCCYIALSTYVHLCSWLILIGRFVCFRRDHLVARRSSSPSSGPPIFGIFLILQTDSMIVEDQLLLLLNRQLQGVNTSLLICKWPVMITSCFFVTLLAWDLASDRVGWFQALWVPVVGFAILMVLWVWDYLSISNGSCSRFVSAQAVHSSLPNNHQLEQELPLSNLSQEFRSSLHTFPPHGSTAELAA